MLTVRVQKRVSRSFQKGGLRRLVKAQKLPWAPVRELLKRDNITLRSVELLSSLTGLSPAVLVLSNEEEDFLVMLTGVLRALNHAPLASALESWLAGAPGLELGLAGPPRPLGGTGGQEP